MKRAEFLKKIEDQFRIHPVCGILGPRQCGKTTIAKEFVSFGKFENVKFFDLENPFDQIALENPMSVLSDLKGLVVIDEIQRQPEIFQVLRVLVDKGEAEFLILGSASKELIKQSSESMAGRIGYLELTPFTIQETQESHKLRIRGGFPLSYLAQTEADSINWRKNYVVTFLEQDISNLGFNVSPKLMRDF